MKSYLICLLGFGFVILPQLSAQDSQDIFAANRALGHGVNFGNALEAPRGANWGITIEEDYFKTIRDAGFQNVRIPIKWSDYAAREKPFAIEAAFFQKIDHLLDLAEQAKLNVILNIHHYDELDREPVGHTERFVSLWKQIAEHYRKRPANLYFELDNEPHDKLIDDEWNRVLVQGLAAIRESNPTRPVIIGPPFWNGIWALSKLKLPEDKNLIVTVHYYNPFEFTHQGASWVEPKIRDLKDLKWTGKEDELAKLRKELDDAAAWGKENHRPIYLGEFGAYQKAPFDSRVQWTSTVAREAEARGFSWSYWEFAAGFGVYDPKEKKWRKPLLEALVPPKSK